MIRIFGIRHHGPGSAHRLRLALEAFRPDCIAVEAPADAEEMFKWVQKPGLVPPVALLVYNPSDFNQAVYLPFAEFSPEWQAIRFGLEQGIRVAAVDLPMYWQFTIDRQKKEHRQYYLQLDPKIDPELARMQLDPMGYMAELAGYTDSERWWDDTFEQAENDIAIFEVILDMMKALRDDLKREESPETLRREAFMRKSIRQLRKSGYQRIAVVCGAWHAPALDRLDQIKQTTDNARLKGLKKTKTNATWIPWSYERLALQRGYRAGVIAPAWYHLLFHHRKEVSIRWLSQAAQLFRTEELDVSSAHVVDAVRLADTLAAMRGRPVPGIFELQEAAASVFFHGSDRPLELLAKKLVFGDAFGRTPGNLPGVPLQKDLEKSIKTARLTKAYQSLEETARTLDLRKETNLLASQLLHRLQLLGISWGRLEDIRETQLGTFKETWNLKWRPEFAIRVIEAGMWGNTVEEACTTYVRSELVEQDRISALTALVEAVFKADLPALVQPLLNRLQVLSAASRDVFQLMEALPALVRSLRYGDVRQTGNEGIQAMVDELIPRICIGLPPACTGIDEEVARAGFAALQQVNRAISVLNEAPHKEQWNRTLFRIAGQDQAQPLLQGACTRLLINKNLLGEQPAARYLQLALSGRRLSYRDAAYWVEGFLHGSGLLLLHQPHLLQLLNEWVYGLTEDSFMEVLPLLRRTFAGYQPAERQKLLSLIRQRPALEKAAPLAGDGYDPERRAIILPVILRIMGLNQN